MKKSGSILVAALLVAFLASPSLAQNLSAGVKGGIDFANLGGDVEDTNSKFGFSAGASFGVQLHEYFQLQFEGQYVRKGTSADELGVDIDFKLDYIEFMVPATLTIPIENSAITPRFYAGPALAIETSCGVTAEEGGVSVDIDCDELYEATGGELELETKTLDFGMFFGGGVDIALGSGAITVDFLYNLGLTNINDVAGTTEDIKNRNIQILAGYKFFFGG
ncbi:MAG: porin family protein [Planctomycetota bacterium]|jgi:hypothetical protein